MIQIRSTGLITAHGRGITALEKALNNREQEPARIPLPGNDRQISAFCVPKEALKDPDALKGMRRADRLSKLAAIAAYDAWSEHRHLQPAPERVGLLVASGLGPHVRTFKFLDGILDFGDSAVSPTDFSHSVHNAAAGYITTLIRSHGPVQTITDFDFAFQQALRLAQCWLEEKRCDMVLAGAVEELGEVMLHVCSRMLNMPADGRPAPSPFCESPKTVPGEGAAFFALTRPDEAASDPLVEVYDGKADDADINILDAEGMSGPEEEYLKTALTGTLTANYVPAFGSMMTGSAFQCAIAALMIKNGLCYPNPSANTGYNIHVCREKKKMDIQSINCLKRNKKGHWQTISLKNSL